MPSTSCYRKIVVNGNTEITYKPLNNSKKGFAAVIEVIAMVMMVEMDELAHQAAVAVAAAEAVLILVPS